tara:strand:+ start:218 stop:433 length:216 start_codon:yes stop_codon:yes gene_type:complete
MALSKQVEDSLRASQEYLRDALSFSARTEKPYVSKHIADMLAQIDNLCDVVPLLDKVEQSFNQYRLDELQE